MPTQVPSLETFASRGPFRAFSCIAPVPFFCRSFCPFEVPSPFSRAFCIGESCQKPRCDRAPCAAEASARCSASTSRGGKTRAPWYEAFPILSRDPNLFRNPSITQGKQIRFLKRAMVDKEWLESAPIEAQVIRAGARFFWVCVFLGVCFLCLSDVCLWIEWTTTRKSQLFWWVP